MDAPSSRAEEMTVEDLRCKMFDILREEGTAQLRRIFIHKMQRSTARTTMADCMDDDHACNLKKASVEEQMNTEAIFVPEIGGYQNVLQPEAIRKMLPYALKDENLIDDRKDPILLMLMKELLRRCQAHRVSSSTQTSAIGFDHRFVLENELRKVESEFLSKCEQYRQMPSQAEKLRRQQQEYQELVDKKFRDDLERFKAHELEEFKIQEQARQNLAMEELRSSLERDFGLKMKALKEKEHQLEADYAKKYSEMEGSQFDSRQQLIKKLNQLREQEIDLQSREKAIELSMEAKERKLLQREKDVAQSESMVDLLVNKQMRHKEMLLAEERERKELELKLREDAVASHEARLRGDRERLSHERNVFESRMQELQAMKAETNALRDQLHSLQAALADTASVNNRLKRDLEMKDMSLKDLQACVDQENSSRLQSGNKLQSLSKKAEKLESLLAASLEEKRALDNETKKLRNEIIAMKMDEASAVGAERKKIVEMLETERTNFLWKEDNLLTKIHELRSRLSEAEATSEKYQAQYEDEKIHVASLRQEVNSLNVLLTQTQSICNSKQKSLRSDRDRSNVYSEEIGLRRREQQPSRSLRSEDALLSRLAKIVGPLLTHAQSSDKSSSEIETPVTRHKSRRYKPHKESNESRRRIDDEGEVSQNSRSVCQVLPRKRVTSIEHEQIYDRVLHGVAQDLPITLESFKSDDAKVEPLKAVDKVHDRNIDAEMKGAALVKHLHLSESNLTYGLQEPIAVETTAPRAVSNVEAEEKNVEVISQMVRLASNTSDIVSHASAAIVEAVIDDADRPASRSIVSIQEHESSSNLNEEVGSVRDLHEVVPAKEEKVCAIQSDDVSKISASTHSPPASNEGENACHNESAESEFVKDKSRPVQQSPIATLVPDILPSTHDHVIIENVCEESDISGQSEPAATNEPEQQEENSIIDIYRQRVLARRAVAREAESSKQSAQTPTISNKPLIMEENDDEDDEIESSSASFAESSKESSDSF